VSWNPWRAAEQRPEVLVYFEELPAWTGGGMVTYIEGHAVIGIDPRLTPGEQRAVLTHELVHAERDQHHGCTRNPLMPAPWHGVVVREERTVNREVARRLVPPDDLWEFCRGMADIHLGVGPAEVAEQFDVPEWVAVIALEQLEVVDPQDELSA
jgi:hypothetical protein